MKTWCCWHFGSSLGFVYLYVLQIYSYKNVANCIVLETFYYVIYFFFFFVYKTCIGTKSNIYFIVKFVIQMQYRTMVILLKIFSQLSDKFSGCWYSKILIGQSLNRKFCWAKQISVESTILLTQQKIICSNNFFFLNMV